MKALAKLSPRVTETVAAPVGEYDARRLRTQRQVIRDVMLSAASCNSWLTLGELHALTKYSEASISAQLRHLRKPENGGYDVIKRHRLVWFGLIPALDARGQRTWEYRIAPSEKAAQL